LTVSLSPLLPILCALAPLREDFLIGKFTDASLALLVSPAGRHDLMPYSKSLAARIRDGLAARSGVVEKRMFGGVAFLLRGNMLVGAWNDSLIARLGPDEGAKALAEPHVGPFDVTGRPMKGWVMVEPDGIDSDSQLRDWIERAVEFVRTLPAK
jgi:hypothetical protein